MPDLSGIFMPVSGLSVGIGNFSQVAVPPPRRFAGSVRYALASKAACNTAPGDNGFAFGSKTCKPWRSISHLFFALFRL